MTDYLFPDSQAPTAPTVQPAPSGGGLFDRACCVLLETRRLGVSRKVQTTAVVSGAVDTDRELLRVSKRILDSPELEAIAKLHGEARRYLRSLVSSSVLTRGSIYTVALDLIPRIDGRLQAYRERSDTLVAGFLSMYETRKAEALSRLGEIGDATEYPDVARVAASFGFHWQYFTFGAPGRLAEVKAEIWAREEEKARATWQTAVDESTATLAAGFADLVSHMVERLTPGDDGKPKVFRDSLVNNLAEFLETFEARNLAGNAALAAHAATARQLLSGLTPEAIRKAKGGAREVLADRFAALKTALDATLAEAPRRKFGADDE